MIPLIWLLSTFNKQNVWFHLGSQVQQVFLELMNVLGPVHCNF